MWRDILKKQTLDENDIKEVMSHVSEFTDADKIRLGFMAESPLGNINDEPTVEVPDEAPKPRRRKKLEL